MSLKYMWLMPDGTAVGQETADGAALGQEENTLVKQAKATENRCLEYTCVFAACTVFNNTEINKNHNATLSY